MSWISRLQNSPKNDWKWRQINHGTVGSLSLSNLNCHLSDSAVLDPIRYARLANAIAQSNQPLDDSTYTILLSALVRAGTDSNKNGPRLDDSIIAELFSHSVYLNNKFCSKPLANAVEGRPSFAWPEPIINRLVAIAYEADDDSICSNHRLLEYRINNTACIALHALASVARRHTERMEVFLNLSESLCAHVNLGIRASAVKLALTCMDANPSWAANLALVTIETSPLIGAEYDIHPWLRFLLSAPSVDGTIHIRAKEALLRIVEMLEPKQAAEHGGIGAICLRTWGHIDHTTLLNALQGKTVARTTVASQVAHWLRDKDTPTWIRDYAIDLANDPEPTVGDAVMRVFWSKEASHLLDDSAFVTAMADSAAGKRDPDDLIHACDQQGILLPVSDLVTRMARNLVDSNAPSAELWKRAHQREQISGLLTRLYEEANRSGQLQIAIQALDSLDLLIDSGCLPSTQILTIFTQFDC